MHTELHAILVCRYLVQLAVAPFVTDYIVDKLINFVFR